jgi:cytochrome b561
MRPYCKSAGRRPDNAPRRHSCAAMLFHWSIAALVLFEVASAFSFGHFNPGDAAYFHAAYRMHMSGGMALLTLSILCVAWRLLHAYPALPRHMHTLTRVSAKVAHILLYVFIIAVPVTGWAILSARHSHAIVVGNLSWPNIAFFAQMTYEQRVNLNGVWLPIHSAVSYVGLGLVGLHTAASIYHHLWRGDTVLVRMLPRMRTPTTNR